jgi:hypothetical protein
MIAKRGIDLHRDVPAARPVDGVGAGAGPRPAAFFRAVVLAALAAGPPLVAGCGATSEYGLPPDWGAGGDDARAETEASDDAGTTDDAGIADDVPALPPYSVPDGT